MIVQKGEDWYNKSVTMPDGSMVFLVPDKGWDFNPGKIGLKKNQEIVSNLKKKGADLNGKTE